MKYIPHVGIAVLLLLAAPIFLVVIFFSGDSCCGEDTRVTMALFTAMSVGMTVVASGLLHAFCKAVGLGPDPYQLLPSAVISALPCSVLYIGFWVWIAVTAF